MRQSPELNFTRFPRERRRCAMHVNPWRLFGKIPLSCVVTVVSDSEIDSEVDSRLHGVRARIFTALSGILSRLPEHHHYTRAFVVETLPYRPCKQQKSSVS